MSRVSCPSNENSEEKKIQKNFEKLTKNFFLKFLKFFFSGFSLLGQESLDIGMLIYLMGNPDCKDLKKYMWEVYFRGTWNWGVWGVWMTFKRAVMAKTLKNGLCMIETNPLNHNWSDFVILSGLTLHQFQKKLLLSHLSSTTQPIIPYTRCSPTLRL